MRAMRKRIVAIFMLAAMLFTMPEIEAAAAGEAKTIILTPFGGQWKYYGQTKTFLEDEHYSLSEYKEVDWAGLYEEYLPQFQQAEQEHDEQQTADLLQPENIDYRGHYEAA